MNRTLKNAYAVSALSEVPASSAELGSSWLYMFYINILNVARGVNETNDIPDNVNKVFEKIWVSFYQPYVGYVCDDKGRSNDVGWTAIGLSVD